MRLVRFFRWSLCALTLICWVSSLAAAQPISPKIAIVTPPNGAALRQNSLYYDPSTEEITVRGIFTDVSETLLQRGVFISVNGLQTPADFVFTGDRTVNGVRYRSGTFSQEVIAPYDFVWPLRRVVAEIVDTKTLQAYVRSQVAIFDLRGHDDATTNESITTEVFGMSSQMTDRGIGERSGEDAEVNLERTQRAMLPAPNLKSFNTTLTSRARTLSPYSSGTGVRACIDYKNLKEERFADKKKFKPFREAMNRANVKFKLYKGAKAACNLLPNPGAVAACRAVVEATYCVKSKPKENDFKLCVDTVEGHVQSLEIGEVTEQGFNYEEATSGNRGVLRSHVSLDKLVGKVDGRLRNLTVEWKNELCLDGPTVDVDNASIPRTKWLNKWATCEDIVVRNTSASTRVGDRAARYSLRADSADSEKIKAGLIESGIFSFTNPQINAARGTCKESSILPVAETMANSFFPRFQNELQTAWYSGEPSTMEAQALDKLFSPYALGAEERRNYDIFAELSSLTSAPLTGFYTIWSNLLTSTHPETLGNQRQQWFHAPARGVVFSPDGKDHLGRRFDLSYSITTGFLNQILNMRNATPQGFRLTYKPTWGQLASFNISPPQGKTAEDRAVLDRRTLSKIDVAFANIGNKKLIIEVRPTLDPIVYMMPDPTGATEIPNVGAPTAYGIESLDVIFKEKDRSSSGVVVPGKEWLRLRGGVVDREFRFGISNKKEAKYLRSIVTDDEWNFNMVGDPAILCRMSFSGTLPGPSGCERRIEGKMNRLMKTGLKPIFEELLSKVPAPQLFDGAGEVKKRSFYLTQANRRQLNQYITFYGLFD